MFQRLKKKNNGKDKIKWITDHNLKRSEIVIYRRFFSNSLVLYKFRVSISFLRVQLERVKKENQRKD